jgi:VCBS repeat-containing protein
MSAARRPSDFKRGPDRDSHEAADPLAGTFLGLPLAGHLDRAEDGHGFRQGGGAKGGGASRNAAPTAGNDSATVAEGATLRLAVLANDSDRNGDPLSVTHLNGIAVAPGGTLTLASGAVVRLYADNTLGYEQGTAFAALNWGQSAVESFTYRISDGRGGTAQANVSITITGIGEGPANSPPVAVNDTLATDEATARTGNVLANDSDPNGDALLVSAVNGIATSVGKTITLASGAKLLMQANGRYSYDPNGAFNALNTGQAATDRITYTVSDGKGGNATANLDVTIAGIGSSAAPTYYVQDLLLSSSQRWNADKPYGSAATVSYTFLDTVPSYYPTGDWAYSGFKSFNAAQRDFVRATLSDLSKLANITFAETTSASTAAITFGFADIPNYTGYAYYPSGNGTNSKAGDVWLDIAYGTDSFTNGSFGRMLLLHELGHAVGLDHVDALTGAENSRLYTVMSYNASPTGAEPSTYMSYDVAALQYLYGANTATATGNNSYRYAELASRTSTLWDAGGIDTLDLSGATGNLVIDLRPGALSSVSGNGKSNLAIAHGAVIENAVGGAGADIIVANQANNRLDGGAGADIFRFFTGWGQDVVGDFQRGTDRLDVSTAGYGFNDLSLSYLADRTVVGAGANTITVLGVTTLSQADFILVA